jgi:hypothetical protein
LNIVVFKGSIFLLISAHWLVVVVVLVVSVKNACNKNAYCYTCCTYLIISFLYLFIIYPLLSHVSHSSVACMKKFLPHKIATQIEAFMAAIIPFLFLLFHCVGSVRAIKNNGKEELLVYMVHIAVGSLYVLAFVFEVMFYSCYHAST